MKFNKSALLFLILYSLTILGSCSLKNTSKSKETVYEKELSRGGLTDLPKDLSDTLQSLSPKCKEEQEHCGEFCKELVNVIQKLAHKAEKNDPRACVACAFHHVLTELALIHEKELEELNKKDNVQGKEKAQQKEGPTSTQSSKSSTGKHVAENLDNTNNNSEAPGKNKNDQENDVSSSHEIAKEVNQQETPKKNKEVDQKHPKRDESSGTSKSKPVVEGEQVDDELNGNEENEELNELKSGQKTSNNNTGSKKFSDEPNKGKNGVTGTQSKTNKAETSNDLNSAKKEVSSNVKAKSDLSDSSANKKDVLPHKNSQTEKSSGKSGQESIKNVQPQENNKEEELEKELENALDGEEEEEGEQKEAKEKKKKKISKTKTKTGLPAKNESKFQKKAVVGPKMEEITETKLSRILESMKGFDRKRKTEDKSDSDFEFDLEEAGEEVNDEEEEIKGNKESSTVKKNMTQKGREASKAKRGNNARHMAL